MYITLLMLYFYGDTRRLWKTRGQLGQHLMLIGVPVKEESSLGKKGAQSNSSTELYLVKGDKGDSVLNGNEKI